MASPAGPRVLLVEDQDAVRDVYADILREAGYQVAEARLANEAEDLLWRDRPDLLLLDLNMPQGEMSGSELLARLRESLRFETLPVVIVSALADVINPDAVEGLQIAAVLQKPVDRIALLNAIAAAARAR